MSLSYIIGGLSIAVLSNAVIAALFWSLGASYGGFASLDEN